MSRPPANKGRITTTDPLKSMQEVWRVRSVVKGDLRAEALFAVGTNTALRSGDIVRLKRDDLRGNELLLRERKTGKLRRIVLNAPTLRTLERYLESRSDSYEWLFVGQRGQLTYGYLGSMVKGWFRKAGIRVRNAAGHSLRKTFVRINHKVHGVPLSTLMYALNHSSERQTLTYCGLVADDVEKVYRNVI